MVGCATRYAGRGRKSLFVFVWSPLAKHVLVHNHLKPQTNRIQYGVVGSSGEHGHKNQLIALTLDALMNLVCARITPIYSFLELWKRRVQFGHFVLLIKSVGIANKSWYHCGKAKQSSPKVETTKCRSTPSPSRPSNHPMFPIVISSFCSNNHLRRLLLRLRPLHNLHHPLLLLRRSLPRLQNYAIKSAYPIIKSNEHQDTHPPIAPPPNIAGLPPNPPARCLVLPVECLYPPYEL